MIFWIVMISSVLLAVTVAALLRFIYLAATYPRLEKAIISVIREKGKLHKKKLHYLVVSEEINLSWRQFHRIMTVLEKDQIVRSWIQEEELEGKETKRRWYELLDGAKASKEGRTHRAALRALCNLLPAYPGSTPSPG